MKDNKTVTAIVSVFNEEKTVKNVVLSLNGCRLIDEIIVVNDGSSDKTDDILQDLLHNFHFRYIGFEENLGKSFAMAAGVDMAAGDIIIFVDSDITGLSCRHIEKLLTPLFNGEADMVLGNPCSDKGKIKYDPLKPLDLLAGQRTVYKEDILPILGKMRTSKYGVETLMNLYYRSQNKKIKIEYLNGLEHLRKYEKSKLHVSIKDYSAEGIQILKTVAVNYVLFLIIIKNLILG
jgi:glycosyltransferase involved in cell wall biosynthesis